MSAQGMKVMAKITLGGEVVAGYNSMTNLGGVDLAEYVEVPSLEWSIERDVDSNAQIRGHVHLGRVRFQKYIDGATPLIAQALSRGQTAEVEFKLFTNASDGADAELMTITCLNGRLSGQSFEHGTSPEASKGRGRTTMGSLESCSLAYETIQIQHAGEHGGQTETEISWTTGGNALG